MAFMIPDSLFDAQNEKLRYFLASKTQIKVIARLGEKIFDGVNRATTVIICKKENPDENTLTKCFRLSTIDRKNYLSGKITLMACFNKESHNVYQMRFLKNHAYNFDIDTYSNEESLISKITSSTIDWSKIFIFGRGVEISKTGKIVYCPKCGLAQGFKKKQMKAGKKICTHCGANVPVDLKSAMNVITRQPDVDSILIYVGENVRRYSVMGESYIKPNIEGINYKNREMYNPPKLLIRKTGLGIYSAIDYTGSMTSQTVYILKYRAANNNTPLEYYLALINSRVIYYYYIKVYGENEWKSHPYLTKQIIFTLPVKPYKGTQLDKNIIKLSKMLMEKYDYASDITLEHMIMKKYGLTKKEKELISKEMNKLPNLSAINDMKMEIML
jgi:hypothetical protein